MAQSVESVTVKGMASNPTAPTIAYLQQLMPRGLDILERMVRLNSYTANKAGVDQVGKFTADCFAELGFTAESVPSVNPNYGDHLVLTRPGQSAATLAMVSHLDTVFSPEEERRNGFQWQPEGDRIYGPGTQDIKGGTLMMWLVLQALRAQAPAVFETVTWQLFWNSSEEVLSHDFGALCRSRFSPNTVAALVFEAEGRLGADRLLVVARKGRATWRAKAIGRAAHAGGKHAHGANAIQQLGRTVEQIAALTDYSKNLTFNVGTIRGGTGLNRVPQDAWAEGELRAFAPDVYTGAKQALLALAGDGTVRSVADRYACRVEIEILSETRPWPRNGATDRLFELWQRAGAELNFPILPEERGGLSDGNFLWDVVPTVDGLGPWGDNDHCSERSADGTKVPEYVEISSFVPKAAVNIRAIRELLKEAGIVEPR